MFQFRSHSSTNLPATVDLTVTIAKKAACNSSSREAPESVRTKFPLVYVCTPMHGFTFQRWTEIMQPYMINFLTSHGYAVIVPSSIGEPGSSDEVLGAIFPNLGCANERRLARRRRQEIFEFYGGELYILDERFFRYCCE